jgi:AraC family transcriptional regulator
MVNPPHHSAEQTPKLSILQIERHDLRCGLSIFAVEKQRCWGLISADVVNRAAGEAVWRTDVYRLTYFLTNFRGTMQDDDRPAWECDLARGNFVFRPPDTTLRSRQTAGRYIQILQLRDSYNHLASEMVRGGVTRLRPRYNLNDALISQLVSTIANELEGGFLDQILADTLNMALAVQMMRLCGDPTAINLAPANGLSRERLKRVYEHIEAHLNDRLTLTDLAGVACLSPYHFSRSFKQAVGVGPQRYVMRRRVERAKRLMHRSNQPLALIAQEAGFTDQSHLTAIFRREIGVTPGQFRAAVI